MSNQKDGIMSKVISKDESLTLGDLGRQRRQKPPVPNGTLEWKDYLDSFQLKSHYKSKNEEQS